MDTNKKTLLLIMPPQRALLQGFAVGLISLANFVKERIPNLDISILDLSTHSVEGAEEKIRQSIKGNQSDFSFVGITTTTASYQSAIQIATFVKQLAPQSIIVFGGHHASGDPEVILRSHRGIVDLIISGEGERSLCAMIQNYPALASIPGLCFLDVTNRFIRNDQPPPLSGEELDSVPITYGNNEGISKPGKFDHVTYVSARGCHLGCAFCAVGNDNIRVKSIPAVIRDIENLLQMGYFRIAIEDNFFAHSASRTRSICEALTDIKQNSNGAFSWDCQTRVESLARKNTIDLMAKAGCEAVYIGAESLHSEHLLYLNKTKNPEKYLNTLIHVVVPALLNTDIDCYLNLQFGLPGETEIHQRTTLAILESLGHLAASHGKTITIFPQLHVIYPATAHFQQGVSQGRFPKDVFETFTKWEFLQTPVLHWLGEHFSHGAGGIPEGILKPEVLRAGKFENVDEVVDAKAVLRISAILRAINRIKGIRTFDYGNYIVI